MFLAKFGRPKVDNVRRSEVMRTFDFYTRPDWYFEMINNARRVVGGPALSVDCSLSYSDNDPTYYDYDISEAGFACSITMEVSPEMFWAYTPFMQWQSISVDYDHSMIGSITVRRFPVEVRFTLTAPLSDEDYETLVDIGKIETIAEETTVKTRNVVRCSG